jgi:hypothetical protein
MTAGRYLYACNPAAKQLIALFGALGQHGVLTYTPERALLEQAVRQCSTCAKSLPAKFCTGWVTVIDPRVATFAPVLVKGGKWVQPELFATADYTREQPGVATAWEAAPMSACDLVLQIVDLNGHLLERHHIDLASPNQNGPVWHLQYGGNPANHPKPDTHWLDPPRWAVPPADLALLLETVAFNFYPEKWEELNANGDWLRAVTAAEDLTLKHYLSHMTSHLRIRPDNRMQTWLAMQDNASWNPRPG